MASASASPPANAHAPQALAKSTLLGGVGDLDAAVSLRLHALFLPVPRLLLKAFEVAGDGRIWLPVPISLLLISTTTSSVVSPLVVGLVVGLVLDLAFVGLAKLIVRRPRPEYNAADMYVAVAVDHWSFPSGHSSRAFLVAAFLADGGFPREALFLWAAATSASRVLLGRHYILDVVAGAWLGVLEAWLSNLILRFLCGRSSFLVLARFTLLMLSASETLFRFQVFLRPSLVCFWEDTQKRNRWQVVYPNVESERELAVESDVATVCIAGEWRQSRMRKQERSRHFCTVLPQDL